MELRALFLGMCVVCVTLVLSIRSTFHSFMVEEQSRHTHDSLKAKVNEKNADEADNYESSSYFNTQMF